MIKSCQTSAITERTEKGKFCGIKIFVVCTEWIRMKKAKWTIMQISKHWNTWV